MLSYAQLCSAMLSYAQLCSAMLSYAQLCSTGSRRKRETAKIDGRTQEIQRLIGRSLRSVVDLDALGNHTIWIDCDVIQADGGTRTASVTGSFVALILALRKMSKAGQIKEFPVKECLAAISVGIVNQQAMLDLKYDEDKGAEVDMNVVMLDSGEFVEVQEIGRASCRERV